MPTIEAIRAFPDIETKEIHARYARPGAAMAPTDLQLRNEALHLSAGWMAREASRLADHWESDKKYTRLPVDWYEWLIPTHYAHRSASDETQIAFTKTTRKGFQDIQTRMKPGRYLQEYYSDRFSADEIRDLVRQLTPAEYRMARTAPEIARVYENGPDSCMSGTDWWRNYSFIRDRQLNGDDDHHNPVGIYATEDVAVAYIQSGNRVTARAVVNLRDNTFGRVYGDSRLCDALSDDGFRQDTYALEGCRLRKIPVLDGSRHYYLMPYLDGTGYVIERGDYLVALTGSHTNAWARWEAKRDELIQMGGTSPVTVAILTCQLTGQRTARTVTAFRIVGADEQYDLVHEYAGRNGRIYMRAIQIARELVSERTWRHSLTSRHIVTEPNHSYVRLDNGNRMFTQEVPHCASRCWLTNALVPRTDTREVNVGYTVAEDGSVTFETQRVLSEAVFYCERSGMYWVVTEQTCMANGTTLSKYALAQRENIVIDEYTGLPWARSSSVRIDSGPGEPRRYARRSIFQKIGHTDDEGNQHLSYQHYLQSRQQQLPMAAE